ncbi:MAG: hypothetical protein AAFX76_14435 [Planctomycetota bacterium]
MASQLPPPPPPPKPGVDPHEADSGDFSNFFNDVRAAWERVGSPLMGLVAIAAIVYAGYTFFTQRAETARQLAWIDLYGATSPESLELLVDSTNNDAVRAVANLRAGDLLRDEALTADEADADAILGLARQRYQAVLDDAPHPVYELNALDGLGVVAESLLEAEAAQEHYETLKQRAGDAFPYWAELADQRLALLPTLNRRVEFAPDPEPPVDPLAETEPESETAPEAPANPAE